METVIPSQKSKFCIRNNCIKDKYQMNFARLKIQETKKKVFDKQTLNKLFVIHSNWITGMKWTLTNSVMSN